MSEFEWIANYFAPLCAEDALTYGLKNDAALLPPLSEKQWVIASDTLIENIHYLDSTPPTLIARKALRVNLSDMAAMGATPFGYLLNLSLSRTINEEWIAQFCQGLREEQVNFQITLLGGDTTASDGHVTISITMLGQVTTGQAFNRSSAKAGDKIFVSGTIGDATIGLAMLRANAHCTDPMVIRHQLPEPRILLGQSLIGHAHTVMDISDGLLQDLQHICSASRVGAEIDLRAIPLCATAQEWITSGKTSLSELLNGGDDYELLCTAPADSHDILEQLGMTCIGTITQHPQIICKENGAKIAMSIRGYQHL